MSASDSLGSKKPRSASDEDQAVEAPARFADTGLEDAAREKGRERRGTGLAVAETCVPDIGGVADTGEAADTGESATPPVPDTAAADKASSVHKWRAEGGSDEATKEHGNGKGGEREEGTLAEGADQGPVMKHQRDATLAAACQLEDDFQRQEAMLWQQLVRRKAEVKAKLAEAVDREREGTTMVDNLMRPMQARQAEYSSASRTAATGAAGLPRLLQELVQRGWVCH
ncbi:unnamed protein product [Closterium sp. NIES-64]|nr:unnamed protein product [Closterium sp. NIES-64]